MNYESRYDWTGERTRRKQALRRIAKIAVGVVFCGILLKLGWGYLPSV
jgi:hypothetical protein